MFQQKINLLLAFQDPEPPVSILGWHKMMLCNVAIIIILVMISIYDYVSVQYLEHKKQALLLEVSSLKSSFESTKSKYPQEFFSQDVSQSVEKITEEMHLREKLLNKIANHGVFSDDLEALTRIITPQVWLTEINILKSGDELQLKGKSHTTEDMQKFLIRLTSDKLFSNYALSVKSIQDNTKTSRAGDLLFDITMVKNI